MTTLTHFGPVPLVWTSHVVLFKGKMHQKGLKDDFGGTITLSSLSAVHWWASKLAAATTSSGQ